ncbi:MAG: patatin-like phospholipase family protein [Bacteroidota bacterium]
MSRSPEYGLGLVLSGGGTRGVAHAAIIKGLLDEGLVPEVVSGASAGALIGALYASGYKPRHMVKFFQNVELFDPKALSWNLTGIINADGFEETLMGYFPDNEFEKLKCPLHVMTTNLLTGEGEVFNRGQLVRPLMASAAVPGIFSPVTIGAGLYADGGIYSNFPVKPLVRKCKMLIGVYVHPLSAMKPDELRNPFDILQRAYDVSRTAAVRSLFRYCDYVMIPEGMEAYGIFDLERMDTIYGLGEQAIQREIKGIKKLARQLLS